MSTEKKVVRRSKKLNYRIGLKKVLKSVHPNLKISGNALEVVDSLMKSTGKRLTVTAQSALYGAGRVKLSAKDIQAAVRISLPGELAKHAVSESTKAVAKFTTTDSNRKKTDMPVRREVKAGLHLSVARTRKLMKRTGVGCVPITAGADIYLTATLEYLAAEILELAGNSAKDSTPKRSIISVRDIQAAISLDGELAELYKATLIPGGNVAAIPFAFYPRKEQDRIRKEHEETRKVQKKKVSRKPKSKKAKKAVKKPKAK